MGEYTIILSEEEEKALLTDMVSIHDWVSNAIHNKGRQMKDKIAEDAAKPELNYLTPDDWVEIKAMMEAQGVPPLIPARLLPEKIKDEIVRRANVKSAAERQAEIEASGG